jgi:signal transduction histidine kinase
MRPIRRQFVRPCSEPEEELDRHDAAHFEELLAEMVATFVRITTDQIDAEISRWLERIGLVMGLDRNTVAAYDQSERTMRTTHCWAREGVNPIPWGIDTVKILPWLSRKVLAGEKVVFSRPEDLPAEASRDLEFTGALGHCSNVTVPMKVGEVVVGAVAFGSTTSERIWPPSLIQRLELIAEVFASALERKRAVDEIYRLHHSLTQVSRVVMMGELTASLTHELNQPLGAILSNAQAASIMLSADQPDLAEVRATLDDIVHDNRRAVDVINWVRTLLRGTEPNKSSVEIEEVLREVERILGHDAMIKHVALRLEAIAPLPPVLGHKTELVQALVNLILNAFDSVSEDDESTREVVVTAKMGEARQLSVTVHDSGRGLDPRVMPSLFDPFVTTKPNGMGMGLAITRSIIEWHGGELRAVPTSTRGATFEFTLPVSRPNS